MHLLIIYYYYDYVFRPTPTIHWRKDGEDALKYRAVTESFGKILKIKEVTKADQGTYHCDAENQMGSTHRSFHVHVEGKSFQRVFGPFRLFKKNLKSLKSLGLPPVHEIPAFFVWAGDTDTLFSLTIGSL